MTEEEKLFLLFTGFCSHGNSLEKSLNLATKAKRFYDNIMDINTLLPDGFTYTTIKNALDNIFSQDGIVTTYNVQFHEYTYSLSKIVDKLYRHFEHKYICNNGLSYGEIDYHKTSEAFIEKYLTKEHCIELLNYLLKEHLVESKK